MASVLVVHSYQAGEMYAAHLRSHGYAVHRVSTPEEAFDFVLEHPPAVIITDVTFRMSAFSGCSFIAALRRMPGCASSRIVAIAGSLNSQFRALLQDTGADLLIGTHEIAELPAHLKRTFSERRREKKRLATDNQAPEAHPPAVF